MIGSIWALIICVETKALPDTYKGNQESDRVAALELLPCHPLNIVWVARYFSEHLSLALMLHRRAVANPT